MSSLNELWQELALAECYLARGFPVSLMDRLSLLNAIDDGFMGDCRRLESRIPPVHTFRMLSTIIDGERFQGKQLSPGA